MVPGDGVSGSVLAPGDGVKGSFLGKKHSIVVILMKKMTP